MNTVDDIIPMVNLLNLQHFPGLRGAHRDKPRAVARSTYLDAFDGCKSNYL